MVSNESSKQELLIETSLGPNRAVMMMESKFEIFCFAMLSAVPYCIIQKSLCSNDRL
jgi:hypothetical protein